MNIKHHIWVVFTAALTGFVLGIILNSLSSTVDFLYNNVLGLATASLIAAFGTWLLSDFCDDAPLENADSTLSETNWKLYSQKLIGAESVTSMDCDKTLGMLEDTGGLLIRYKDGSRAADEITQILIKAQDYQHHTMEEAFPKKRSLLQHVLDEWQCNKSEIWVLHRESFIKLGIEDRFAIGMLRDGTLKVFVGVPNQRPSTSQKGYDYESAASYV